MNKYLLLLLSFIVVTEISIGQTYNMSNTTVNTCGGTFYDQGGPSADYGNNQFIVMSFCSSVPIDQIQITFTSFGLHSGDNLHIYDGPNTLSPHLGQFSGTTGPGTITSSFGCLTFVFTSNSSGTDFGWAATITCIPNTIPPCTTTGCPVGSSAPANDNCSGAINITVPAPGSCPGNNLGQIIGVNANNNCATPGNPYQYQISCQPSGNMSAMAADVWYTFVITGSELNIIINGLSTPNIGLYRGNNCDSLFGVGCAVGSGGSLTATFQGLAQGQYYLQVSGADPSDQCNFTLSLQNNRNCTDCVVSHEITANPPPLNGTYPTGQAVTFCYTIYEYNQVSGNWLHAVIPGFGPGWDLSTLTGFQPADSCSGVGTWSWYNSQVTSSATGYTFGPGFFYESWQGSTGGVADTNPGNNYGDYNPASTCSWTFCWTISALPSTQCTSGTGLEVTVTSHGDGESGSWASLACTGDPVALAAAILACCPSPTVTGINPPCAAGNTGSATGTGQGSGPFIYEWIAPNGTILQTINNTSGPSTINNLGPGAYTFQTTDSANCISAATITITQLPDFTLTTNSTPTACGDSTGSVSVTVNGNTGPYTFLWNGGATSAIINNLPTGSYTVTVTDTNGCIVTVSDTVHSYFNAVITASGTTTFCAGSSVTLNADTVIGLSYQWQLDGINIPGETNSFYDATITGDYSVMISGICGNSISNIISVSVMAAPGSTGVITGPDTICRHTTQIYSVFPVSGATNYVWTVPQQAQINSGSGTNTIAVHFKVKQGNVTIKAANQCGAGPLSVLPVQVVKCFPAINPTTRATRPETEIEIYPNPSQIDFNFLLNTEEDGVVNLTIYDYAYRVVEIFDNMPTNQIHRFGKNLAPGFYFVEVDNREVKEIRKIVKVK